jgi:hypothetical protein
VVDGIVKGLPQPDWPADGWQALQRLAQHYAEHYARSLALGAEVATTARQGYNAMGEYGDQHGLEGMRQMLSVRFKKRQASANDDVGDEGAA